MPPAPETSAPEAPELRAAWTCAACAVTARRPEVGPIPAPGGWEHRDAGLVCLACVRRADLAAEGNAQQRRGRERATALAAEKRARERRAIRAALLALDDPGAAGADELVAERTGCASTRAGSVRRELIKDGTIERGSRGGNGSKGAFDAAVRALREDHRRSDADVAAASGTSLSTVKKARTKTGLRYDSREEARQDALDALRRLGEVTIEAVATELGIQREAARQRLDRLVREKRAVKRPDPAGGSGRTRFYSAVEATAATPASG